MEKIAWIAGMAVSGICTLAAAGLALFAEPAELAAMGVETGRREREAEKRVPDADRFMERHSGCAVYCGMLVGAEPDRHGVRSLNEYFDGAERDADAAKDRAKPGVQNPDAEALPLAV